jgi:uncharacterized protein (TIGR02118 family)
VKSGLRRSEPGDAGHKGATMIKVNILYPSREGATFDMDYYLNKHVPMVLQLVGDACKGGGVDEGVCGADPASAPTYAVIGHLLFESVEEFQASFGPHAAEIMADLPNFTNCEAMVQITEIKM